MKTILITGASSGIGEATARRFAKEDVRLILCARSADKLASLKQELSALDKEVHAYAVDVRNQEQIGAMFTDLASKNVPVDVVINNAGLALGMTDVKDGETTDWDQMIDTNIKGLLYMTRAGLQGMVARNSGHIVNIGSIAGTQAYAKGAVYCATKVAVRFISDALRQEVVANNIRVTNIQPGMAETNFSNVRFRGDEAKADKVYEGIEAMTGADVAEAIAYAVLTPENIQISDLSIMPTHQAGQGVVHRKV